ncbi:nose resistant to fluoxetine protein 6-like [Homalodisca vitripennis]|uniref:nose resistant to fluoxetine protein 6-like n=1 Tax=Homalodisca vitripennis TaxID=197043 RepID=UPI001EEA9754|nr:nose resistant to fluoxetine protein 6-like [Homalodisca vitripennis]
MRGWTIIVLLFLGISLPSSGDNAIDGLITESLVRVGQMQQILLPVPEDMLQEAWFLMGSYIIPLDSVTEGCRNHSSFLFESFLKREMWALKMVDAAGKPGAGILDGNIMFLGNYDECLSVSAPGGLFRGQQCIVETSGLLSPDAVSSFTPNMGVLAYTRNDVMFSVCVPDSCTAQDVKIHLDVALNSINVTAIMYDSSCSSATSPPLNPADYLVILVLLTIVVLVTLSTCYDNLTSKSEQNDLLVSFSVTSNTSQLLSTSDSPDSLPCLHGLRVLAMVWIIAGHRFMHEILVPDVNGVYIIEHLDRLAWIPYQSIGKTVEIFFLLSGTLAAYNFFRDRLKGKRFHYLSFCCHRYRRLTPTVLLVSIFYATLLIRVADGPIWKRMFSMYQENCQENWWINLLYISNYVVPYSTCMPWTWYVAVDFQLHVLSPLLLLVIYKKRALGFFLAGIVLLASNSYAMTYFSWNGLSTGGMVKRNLPLESFTIQYTQTHFRLNTFIIGLCFGYLLYRIKQKEFKVKLSKTQLLTGWVVAALLFLGTLFSMTIFDDPEYVQTPWLDTTYPCLEQAVGSPSCHLGHLRLHNREVGV